MNIKEYKETEKTEKVEKTTKLKEILVDYVGNKLQPENEEVTVDMIVQVLSDEFPEFLLVVAEENFFRGYEQAFQDLTKFDSAEELEKETEQ